MPPELFAWSALFFVAILAAVLFVPRLLPARRVRQAAGTAAVSPERSSPASGGMAVPVITDLRERQPFAYDNGLTVEPAEGGIS